MNRAQLRPHRDTQIRSRDTVAFGDSAVAFRVVALEPDNIPFALETALEHLVQNQHVAGEQGDRGVSEVDSSLVEKHAELLSQAQSPHSSGTVWLQVCFVAGSLWCLLSQGGATYSAVQGCSCACMHACVSMHATCHA